VGFEFGQELTAGESVLINNFENEEITTAKTQLLDDIRNIETDVKVPHISARREGEQRTLHEVDDIITLLNFLDTHKLLDKLPCYVCDKPDDLPSTHLSEGDLKFVFSFMEKMNARLDAFGVQMAAIARDVHALQWMQTKPVLPSRETGPPPPPQFLPSRPPAVNKPVEKPIVVQSAARPLNENSDVTSTPQRNMGSSNSAFEAFVESMAPLQRASINWGADSQPESATSGDEGAFHEFASRRAEYRNARRQNRAKQEARRGTYAAAAATDAGEAASAENQQRRAHRRRPLLIGKACNRAAVNESDNATDGLAAAERIIKKAVFYVDNIKNTFSAGQVKDFIMEKMDVEVVTCHSTEQRKRRKKDEGGKTGNTDRAGSTRQAFRVCINDADRDKFLDESKWPQHVIVSEWYFKPKSQEAQESKNKRGRTDSDDSSTATRRKASRSDDNDMDATILSGAVGGSPLAATSGL